MASNQLPSNSIARVFSVESHPVIGLVILLLSGILAGCDSRPAAQKSSSSRVDTGTVQLEIDFGGRQKKISMDVPCSADSTVFQILERAREMADFSFSSTGTGETVFVRSIDGVENEGSDGDNWVYRVNEELGDRSCGVYPVQPGDRVLWVLGEYP